MQAAQRDTAVLQECGVPYRLMTTPAPSPSTSRRWPTPGPGRRPAPAGRRTGDCQRFTTELADAARALGVQFRFGVQWPSCSSAAARSAA
jgi:D-amino-acid dehydrogenase